MADVFVYGTLLYDEIIYALLDKNLESQPVVLKGYKRYKKETPNASSWGPVIVAEPEAEVTGRLVMGLDDRDMDIFDRYESSADGVYERIACEVFLHDGKKAEAFVYCGTDKIRPYLKSAWPQDEFEEKGLKLYVEERIPELRKQWGV